MHKRSWLVSLFAFAAALAFAGQAAAQVRVDVGGRANENAREGGKVDVAHSFRSSHIIGMRVKNKDGKDIGKIEDLVIGLAKGDIRYAALSFGGFAGFGTKLFAVPWQAMTFRFGENDRHFVFDVTEDQLKNAPGFDHNNWPNVADQKWATSVDKYYKVDRNADHPAGGNTTYDDAYRVSTIKGMKVRNPDNKDLGYIDELVFDIKAGKVNYAALSYGSFAGLGGKLFAVPFHAFKFHHDGDNKFFVLNISEDKLKGAPGFDSNHWPDMADPNWSRDVDRYYEDVRTAAKP
jgi:sporulation protein YlmC with PRC-barrel domain